MRFLNKHLTVYYVITKTGPHVFSSTESVLSQTEIKSYDGRRAAVAEAVINNNDDDNSSSNNNHKKITFHYKYEII